MEGELSMKEPGMVFNSWTKIWCVLQDGRLTANTMSEPREVLWVIQISSVARVDIPPTSALRRAHRFDIMLRSGDGHSDGGGGAGLTPVISLAASTEEELTRWGSSLSPNQVG